MAQLTGPRNYRQSRGCFACRAKRIKCDQSKPQCQQCLNLGRPCPGYRDQSVVLFKSMNRSIQRKVYNTSPTEEQNSSTSSLSLGIITKAITRFFSEYVLTATGSGVNEGYLEFLPEMFYGTETSRLGHRSLRKALPAVDLANMGRQLNKPEILLQAKESYGEALTTIAAAVEDPAESRSDELLSSISLIGFYEIITGEKPNDAVWDSHMSGRLLVLRLRGYENFQTLRGIEHFRILHTSVLMGCLLRRVSPPDESLSWLKQVGNVPWAQKSKILVRVIQFTVLVETGLQSFEGSFADQLNLQQLIEEGDQIDQELQRWTQTLPISWNYEKIPKFDGPWSMESGAPREIHIYRGIMASAEWNNYRAIRMHLLERLLELSNAAEQCQMIITATPTWIATLLEIAENICASVPFALGKVDMNGRFKNASAGMALGGYSLILALRMTVTCLLIPKKCRQWVIRKLKYISETMGIAQAERIATVGCLCPQIERSPKRFGGPIDLRDFNEIASQAGSPTTLA